MPKYLGECWALYGLDDDDFVLGRSDGVFFDYGLTRVLQKLKMSLDRMMLRDYISLSIWGTVKEAQHSKKALF